jgi:hypothetical protein
MAPAMVPLALLVADERARRWGAVTWRTLRPTLAGAVVMFGVAQGAFTVYYRGLDLGGRALVPGFHAELHRVAADAARLAAPGEVILEYQTGRQRRPLPRTVPPVIETSHPTLRFYLDRVVPVTDSLTRVLEEPGRTLIITRWNRIDSADVARAAQAGRTLERAPLPYALHYYALWTLSPRPAAR